VNQKESIMGEPAMHRPNGLFIPFVTPLKEDETVDASSLERLAAYFAEMPGTAGLVTCARIGEGPVLTFDEQLTVNRLTAGAVTNGKPIIATIGPRSTPEAIEQIEAVAAAGATHAMIIPPLLFAWGDVPNEVKMRFFQELDKVTPIPLVLFQVPVRDYWYDVPTICEIAGLPSVTSMKEASFDVQQYTRTTEALARRDIDMAVLNGNDRFVAEGSILGADGALIGIANVMAPAWAAVHDLGAGGKVDESLDLQRSLRPLQHLIFGEPILEAVARIKVVLAHEGIIENPTVRRPQIATSAENEKRIIAEYEELKRSMPSEYTV
jgi:4-hydroxy-tetrahydrodipicolinate synthase